MLNRDNYWKLDYKRQGKPLSRQEAKMRYNYYYPGLDPRRMLEMAYGGLVEEDNNNRHTMANLSRVARSFEYPSYDY